MTANAALFTSTTPEWYTPTDLLAEIAQFFADGYYDPCPARVADRAAIDGLTTTWAEHAAVFVNPPYGRTIGAWTRKAQQTLRESGYRTEVLLLVPARTDTAWFQPLFHHSICFLRGRLRFSGAVSGAPFPSALVYLGYRSPWFAHHFQARGPIVVRHYPAPSDQ